MLLKTWSRFILPTLLLLALPALSMAQVSVNISVGIPPPELPVYDQPPIPDYGYIWTPGYWAWSDDDQDYYWVPGTWALAPQPGFLWTPGYWGAEGAVFIWHLGYWGPHVGFYGGVNYGYGYIGRGYEGGYWEGGRLYYNRTVNNITTTNITNVYNKTVINNVTVNRVSYNGGNGGVQVRPTPAEEAATRERDATARRILRPWGGAGKGRHHERGSLPTSAAKRDSAPRRAVGDSHASTGAACGGSRDATSAAASPRPAAVSAPGRAAASPRPAAVSAPGRAAASPCPAAVSASGGAAASPCPAAVSASCRAATSPG